MQSYTVITFIKHFKFNLNTFLETENFNTELNILTTCLTQFRVLKGYITLKAQNGDHLVQCRAGICEPYVAEKPKCYQIPQ